MINHFDHMSIWDLCHRWHGYDPDDGSESEIPLKVKDTIKAISQGLTYCQMSVCDAHGIEKKNPNDCPKLHQYWPDGIWREREKGDPEKTKDDPTPDWSPEGEEDESWYERQIYIPPDKLSAEEIEEQYRGFRENWQLQHWKLVEGLSQTYTTRTYNRKKLESVHINRSGLTRFCRENNIDVPQFWFTAKEINAIKTNPEFDPDYDIPEVLPPPATHSTEENVSEDQPKQSAIARKAANQRHSHGNRIKELFISEYLEAPSKYSSKIKAAQFFLKSLPTKDQGVIGDPYTLTKALAKHLKQHLNT